MKCQPKPTTHSNLIVVKFGGSLIEWAPAKLKFRQWITTQPNSRLVVFPGGGHFVERIREKFTRGEIDEQQSHVEAIDQLNDSRRLIQEWLPEASVVSQPECLGSIEQRLMIFDCCEWAKRLDVPSSWDVSSDSLAAILANEIDATEIVLIKSRYPNCNIIEQDSEIVDPLFWRYAKTPVRIVNLRSATH